MNLIQRKSLSGIDSFFDVNLTNSFPMLQADLALDVYEKNGDIIAEMSLPGMEEVDIDIYIEEELLTITGVREEEKVDNGKDYYSKEIKRGSFSRTVRLPRVVEAEKAVADYKNGVLKVTVPFSANAKEKGVKVPFTT